MAKGKPYDKKEKRQSIASAIVLALRLDKNTGKKHIVTYEEETGYNVRTDEDI